MDGEGEGVEFKMSAWKLSTVIFFFAESLIL